MTTKQREIERLERRAVEIITEVRGPEYANPKMVRAMMKFREEALVSRPTLIPAADVETRARELLAQELDADGHGSAFIRAGHGNLWTDPALRAIAKVLRYDGGIASAVREYGARGEWIAVRINDDGWDVLTAEASLAALRTADASSDEGREAMTAVEAFDMGYAWQQMLRGQTLEDSRAVGRTLYCDLFEPIAPAIHREVEAQGFNSFQDSDRGICAAKAIIKAAIRNPEATRGTVVDDAQGGADLHDVVTHRRAWREALEIARATAKDTSPDRDEPSYWDHEIAAFDRTFDVLALLAGGLER